MDGFHSMKIGVFMTANGWTCMHWNIALHGLLACITRHPSSNKPSATYVVENVRSTATIQGCLNLFIALFHTN